MKIKLIYILLLFLLPLVSIAQVDKIREADKKFERYAFIDAREIYLEVAEAGYQSINLFKKLGDSYYFNSDMKNAEKWYEKLFQIVDEGVDELPKEYYYRYAHSLRSVEKYNKADEMLLKYDALTDQNDSRAERIRKEKNYLELIEMQSGKFELDTIDINSKLSDFAPAFFENQLVFASNREKASAVKAVHEWNNQPFLDLYKIDLDNELNPTGTPEEFQKIINSKFHESSAAFTKDGNTIYFTRNNFNDNKYGESEEGINYLKIYRSEKNDEGEWSNPEELPFNSDEFATAHPALNKDETKLYFTSDRPGTLGMSDIFVVDILEDGGFGEPKNLGEEINTEGRETFPFVSNDNLLFFASDGHIGLGGLDVFVCTINRDGSYGEVINLGRPVNSPKDDFSFILKPEKEIGFFATNRGEDDAIDNIYKVKKKKEFITKCKQYIEGKISENENDDSVEGVKIELLAEKDLEVLQTTYSDENGAYKFEAECDKEYVIRVSKEGFKTIENIVQTSNQYEDEVQENLNIKKGDDLGIAQVKQGDDLRDALQLDPIYFDLNKSEIRKDAEVELQKVVAVLKQYPNMKIDVRSHTDSRAADQYNKILSNKRAKATVDYIVSKGIDRSRVTGKGYGETQLVNHCKNGVDCSEEEHELNRRSEFIILNENETPEKLRKQIAERQKEIEAKNKEQAVVTNEVSDDEQKSHKQDKQQQSSSQSEANDIYDFNSKKEVYTVQIGAFAENKQQNFNHIDDVFAHTYDDGIKRYYSKTFETKQAALNYRKNLINKGVEGVFIVKLKGDKRLWN
ncbi:MAG: OmpA family protein [Bacteroidota bacterium]